MLWSVLTLVGMVLISPVLLFRMMQEREEAIMRARMRIQTVRVRHTPFDR